MARVPKPLFLGIILPSTIILVSLAASAYAIVRTRTVLEARKVAEQAAIAKLESNRQKLRAALFGLKNLSLQDVESGFWYSYRDRDGNESVAYFDPEGAVRADLTDVELAELLASIRGADILPREQVRRLRESELASELRFHNDIYRSAVTGTSTAAMARQLEAKLRTGGTSEDLFKLSYLKELSGEYAARDDLNRRNCTQFKQRCEAAVRLILRGTVVDAAGSGVQGASVSVPSRPEIKSVITDTKGAYEIAVRGNEMEKVRIRASKRNFTDGYAETTILQGARGTRHVTLEDIRLESPVGIVTIDYERRSVTGVGNAFNVDGSVTIRTARSTYRIPPRGIVHQSAAAYAGETVDVYLYEFTKGNPPENLLQLDTFDAVRGYAGNLMKSFGMPYIQFFSPQGEELHVLSSNPMLLRYTISDMDALRENTDRIYQALTDENMATLVAESKKKPYAIDREFLISREMLQFPAFWVLDRRRGVWDNVGVTVLNPQGTIDTVFYTIRDAL